MSKNVIYEQSKRKKKKKEDKAESSKSSKTIKPSFLVLLINFFLAFGIGAIVIVIFFALMTGVQFTDTFHLEFLIKALVSLILSALVLNVADKVSPVKGLYAKGIPLALFTLFLCLIIWHFGSRTEAISVPDWNYGGLVVSEKEESKEVELTSDFQEENPYDHMTPSYVFDLDKGEESSWVNFSEESRISIWGDSGGYDIIYIDGQKVSLKGGKEIDGGVEMKVRSRKDNQKIYVYSQRL